MKKSIIVCIFFLFSSCIFSNDDIKDYKVVGNFYVSSFAEKHSLIYKNKEESNLIGTGFVILKNIDSVGYYTTKILAVVDDEYYFIDTNTHQIINQFKNGSQFYQIYDSLRISKFDLKKVGN